MYLGCINNKQRSIAQLAKPFSAECHCILSPVLTNSTQHLSTLPRYQHLYTMNAELPISVPVSRTRSRRKRHQIHRLIRVCAASQIGKVHEMTPISMIKNDTDESKILSYAAIPKTRQRKMSDFHSSTSCCDITKEWLDCNALVPLFLNHTWPSRIIESLHGHWLHRVLPRIPF